MPERAYQLSAGVVLLIVLTIAYGGTFVLSVSRGNVPANDLQRRFFRAGHAHAGVLVILSLLVLALEELNRVRAPYPAVSFGILAAAVLMPTGFFLSVTGRDPVRPNRAIALPWTGAAVWPWALSLPASASSPARDPEYAPQRGRAAADPAPSS
jgi:hypothetical protein